MVFNGFFFSMNKKSSGGSITATTTLQNGGSAPSYSFGEKTIHYFTENGTINFNRQGTVGVVVIAGGGGGGNRFGPQNNRGSPGGAGGVIYIPAWSYNEYGVSTTYNISVGAGGSIDGKGGDSVVTGTGSSNRQTLTALGGGHGTHGDGKTPSTGGSTGGVWFNGSHPNPLGLQPPNTNDGTSIYNDTGYGTKGGDGSHPPTQNPDDYENSGAGGGGGGAKQRGENAGVGNDDVPYGAHGGDGIDLTAVVGTTNIGDTNHRGWFAGGGSCDTFNGDGTQAGDPGKGGGGKGNNSGNAIPAQPNTGGGGGSNGVGGSGIVIFIV